mgnify:CR=1 FL=1
MEAKNFEFANTNNALAELSEALVNLNAAVAAKKNDIKAQKKQEEALLKAVSYTHLTLPTNSRV